MTDDSTQATLEREQDVPVIEPGFTPVSNVTVMKKNGRYVAVATRKLKVGELVEMGGFVALPYRSNEPDQRAKMLANFLPVVPCTCETCKIMGPNIAVPTGNLIYCQFSSNANLDITFDNASATYEVRAISMIEKMDEMFVDFAKLYPKTETDQEAMFKQQFGEDGLGNS